MGLNPRGRGRGRGNFQAKGRFGGGIIGPRQMFRPGQPGMFCPPVGIPPQGPFGTPPNFGGPSGFNFRPPRPAFGKFPRNNFKKKFPPKNNSNPAIEVDLTKPWVTEEIKNEENKKLELLQIWRKTKADEDWNNYKSQKLTVQSLYEKAKTEYASSHPGEALLWENISTKSYYCESCDKSFKTDDDLYLHEAEHETCGRDGCNFTAHPKIIAKHIKMQHLSGLYERIGKLYSKEDIEKWIEERKKRYPTRKVVEEKEILEKEKQSRGERIKDNNSKFNKKFQNKNKGKKNFEKKIQKNNKNRRIRKKKNPSVVQECLEEEISSIRKGVPAFLGINNGVKSKTPEKDNIHISDEEWETECKVSTNTKPILNNSLGLLAACYDSEEEDKNEELQKEIRAEDVSADEGSGPEEVVTVTSKNLLTKENLNEVKGSQKRKLIRKNDENQYKKRQNTSNVSNSEKRELTLLEKLLKKEIRHERNVILQCVHYVVKNNFFKT